jgi:peroxiredoxin
MKKKSAEERSGSDNIKAATIAQVAFILAAAGAVYLFVSAAQSDQRRASCTALCSLSPAYAGRNRLAPDFELPDINGKLVKLSSFRGKSVYLNFWTKTCRPCLDEMPTLAELAKISKHRSDFVVVTVSTDEGPEAVRDALQIALNNEEPPFPILFDPESEVVLGRYGTKLYPETWIIDPDGVIRARFDGPREWSDALALEIGEMVARPGGCPVEFDKGVAKGPFAGLCGDDS